MLRQQRKDISEEGSMGPGYSGVGGELYSAGEDRLLNKGMAISSN